MTSQPNLEEAVAVAVAALGGLGALDVPIGTLTTCRVGGNAAIFVEVNSGDDVAAVSAAVLESGLPMLTIGRGSNMLVSDNGFPGIAMAMGDGLANIEIDGLMVTAGAATPLPVLARRTVKESLAGLEWAVGVPGSVGGAVRMNAGGHGADVAASLVDVVVFDVATRVERVVLAADLGLRFRGSNLSATDVVLSARFKLGPGSAGDGELALSEIVRWRRENQPGGQNAGSVFVNPFDGADSAGRMIDAVGLKGMRRGSAMVSTKHANFIQVDDGGSAEDVKALMDHVAAKVADKFGVRLRSEIRLIGFDDQGEEGL